MKLWLWLNHIARDQNSTTGSIKILQVGVFQSVGCQSLMEQSGLKWDDLLFPKH